MIRTPHFAALTAAILLAGSAVAAKPQPAPVNRSLGTIHQPVVQRTDYVIDLATTPQGLAPGEAERLSGWFDGLDIGYGDSITLDDPSGWHGAPAQDAIGGVVARYGMLVSHDAAPVTTGRPGPGTIRVVVSRAVAHVDGCPDWRHANAEYAGGNASNFGCATESNLAAMIANPEDLVEGRSNRPGTDAAQSVKAIKAYRDAATTGAGGLKEESSKSGGN